MAARKPAPPSRPVEIEDRGKTYTGHYVVDGGVVTVSVPLVGQKSTQVGGASPETVARWLLRELVSERKENGPQ